MSENIGIYRKKLLWHHRIENKSLFNIAKIIIYSYEYFSNKIYRKNHPSFFGKVLNNFSE